MILGPTPLGELYLHIPLVENYILALISAGYSEDSDYTSDVNFPINGPYPNAATSQYLQVYIGKLSKCKSRSRAEDKTDEKLENGTTSQEVSLKFYGYQ